jgi:pimeloyl-ACP methyl ester carboxylesterase
MGGFVGMRLAARRPGLVRSLVLIDTAADREPLWNVPRYRLMSLLARMIGYPALLPPIMKIMCAPTFRNDPERAAVRRRLEEHLLGLAYAPTRAALEAVVSRRSVEHELSHIRIPTLVLHGSADVAIVPSRALAMAQAIPGARFVTIPRAGHTSTVEEPAAVNKALDEFLRA